MRARYLRRIGLLLGGMGLGLLLFAVGVYVYFRFQTNARLAETVLRSINLPSEAFELEDVEGDSIARIVVRRVVVRGENGDTLAAAPLARMRIRLASLAGEGPIVIDEVRLERPSLNVVQGVDGEVNLAQAMIVTADGEELEEARPVVLRDIRIADGSVRLLTPFVPDSLPIRAEHRAEVRTTRVGGQVMRVRTVQDLDARLAMARVGGGEGWRVEVAELTAQLTDPSVRVDALQGFAEADPQGRTRFAITRFRTGDSELRASGVMNYGGERLTYDVQVTAAPLAFADMQWVVPALPTGGQVTGEFDLASRPNDRVAIRGRDMVVTAFDSRASGYFSVVTGGAEPAIFGETRISLDPLRLETLEALGLGESIPYTGEIRGTVASAGGEGTPPLRLDLVATVSPTGEDVPPSTIAVQGPVTLGGEEGVRFRGLQVQLRPLHLAALRPMVTERPERLRGTARGTFLLSGSMNDLRVGDGDLTYLVGDAPPSRLTGIRLRVQREPELSFDVALVAQPIALGTLAELFPALPFRTATFSGPIRLVGTMDQFRVDADLGGSAGRIAVQGTVMPGTPLRFDLSGRVSSFSPDAVLTGSVPVEGPMTGTFAAAGSAQDFGFNVDLAQADGRFALQGRMRNPGGAPPVFRVAGDVSNFNLGAIIGRPRLFPSRMTGPISLQGGGGDPYRFDVDLRSATGILDVEGFYQPGTVPSYSVAGNVSGLNLSQLPGGEALPPSDLRGQIDLEGRGATLETFAGRLRFNATGSTLAGLPLEAMQVDLTVTDGVLQVETLNASLAGSQLTASGTWGLTRPVPSNQLTFRLVARDLARLRPLLEAAPGLQPQLAGSFVLQGTVAGSVGTPVIDVAFRGQNLRYDQWRAARLEFDTDVTLLDGFNRMQGELTLSGDGLALGGAMSFDSLRVRVAGTEERMAVRLVASQRGASDVQLAGVMELEGRAPRGVLLDSLTVRAGDTEWRLEQPASIQWAGTQGVRVGNLVLRRLGDAEGLIHVDGTIPPAGDADLRVTVRNLDLEIGRRILPTSPEIEGVVDLDLLLQGPIGDPELSVQGRASSVRYRELALDSVVLRANYDERRMETFATFWSASQQTAVLEALVPMRLSVGSAIPQFELLRTEPVRARLQADSLAIALLTAPFPTVEDGAGVIAGEVTLAGTIARPQVGGFVTVTGGAVTIPQLGRRYDQINGRLILDEQTILVDNLVIWSDGQAVVNGSVRLDDLTRPELYLTAQAEGFHAIDNPQVADLTVSTGPRGLQLTGRMPAPVLTGDLRLEKGAIYIPSLNEQAPLEIAGADISQIGVDTAVVAGVGPTFMERVRITDLNVAVEEGVWLESDEARVQIRGSLVVVRTGPDFRIYGTLQAVRGTYALTIGPLVREFEVVSGSIRFFGTPDFNPELDITAEHEIRAVGGTAGAPALNIVVRLTGTLEYPRVALTSGTQPPLPESELLSYLIFGQPSFRLNETTGAFAQQVLVQELLGGLLIQELGQLGLPCQYFRLRGRPNLLNSDPLRSTSVECGVQLLPDLFLTLETGVLPAGTGSSGLLGTLLGVSLDWEVNRFVTARLAREPVQSGLRSLILVPVEVKYQWSADVKGRWEFGRPRVEELPEPTPPEEVPVELPPEP